METLSLDDLDEIDLLLTELKISQRKGNLILCTVASPTFRKKVIETIRARFPSRILPIEDGDSLISDLRSIRPNKEEILIWTLPETLGNDILDALNNFRELFYDAGVPSLMFVTPAALDDVIWKAPDFWRYRGGYHILKGEYQGRDYQALEALSMPISLSYQNKDELLRRKRINEHLLERISDQKERAIILNELGNIYSMLSELRKAIDLYDQTLTIAREIEDKRIEITALCNIGIANKNLGDVKKAIQFCDKALAISKEIGDKRVEGRAIGGLGLAYAYLGDIKKAIEYYNKALSISREIGDKSGEGDGLGYFGNIYAAMGNAKKAIEYYNQALAISREMGDKNGEGRHLGNLGNVYAAMGDAKRAIEYYNQALAISRKIGNRSGEGNNLINLGMVYKNLGDINKAIESTKEAYDIYKQIESPQVELVQKRLAQLQGDEKPK